MNIAVLYSPAYSEHLHLIEAAQSVFSKVLAVPLDRVSFAIDGEGVRFRYKNTDLFSFDIFYPRFFSEDLPLVGALRSIVSAEYPQIYMPLDEDSFAITSHKFYTMKILAEAGLPIPPSVFTVAHREAYVSAEELGYPVVVKLSSRTGGKGVLRASSPSDLVPLLDTLELFERDLSLQSYIKNPGEDVRILVIGEDTYSYKRVGPPGEWRSNIQGGGRRVAFDAPQEARELAVMAAKAIGLEFAGVDMIFGEDGPYIVEVNLSPGIGPGVTELLGVNVAELIMQHIFTRAHDHRRRRITSRAYGGSDSLSPADG